MDDCQGSNSEDIIETSQIQKKDKVTERLQKRQDDRLANIEKIRVGDKETTSKKSSVDYFTKTFQEEVQNIKKSIDSIGSTSESGVKFSKLELIEKFDALTVRVQKLQKFVADYITVLPSYNIRNAQVVTGNILDDIQDKRGQLLPKKKFAFNSRKKETMVITNQIEKDLTKEVHEPTGIEFEDLKGFFDKSSENLQLDSNEMKLQDISLSNLTSCKIVLKGYPSALHVNRLKNCTVFCGPVPGSVFVDNCEDCVFIIACQQLRVHHTKTTQFYLHVTSRAIIEDTTTVYFAPYSWDYSGKDVDFKESGLDLNRNNWDDVDDFNWLASDKHSPNWEILPEVERTKNWDT